MNYQQGSEGNKCSNANLWILVLLLYFIYELAYVDQDWIMSIWLNL